MMMADYEIEQAQHWFNDGEHPNLHKGAQALQRLLRWTNSRSDGWGYWRIPSRSAETLMAKLKDAREMYMRAQFDDYPDLSVAQLSALIRPIRAMLRKQGEEDTDMILFPPPPPPPPAPPVETWVYLPGDTEGPDLFGVLYADEDPAMENAMENDGVAWKIKALLIPQSAVKVWEKEEEDD